MDSREFAAMIADRAANPTAHSEALVRETLHSIFTRLRHYDKTIRDDAEETLYDLIIRGGYPDDVYRKIGCGAYKECYALSTNFVIKFIAADAGIENEKAIYDYAHSDAYYDVNRFFVKTLFVPLFGFTIPLEHLCYEAWDEDESSSEQVIAAAEKEYCNYIEIQPRIWRTCGDNDDAYFPYDIDGYAMIEGGEPEKVDCAFKDENGEKFECKELLDKLHIHSKKWLQCGFDYFGRDKMEALGNFIEKFCISDLHNDNIGYMKDHCGDMYPVIIDWMSMSELH